MVLCTHLINLSEKLLLQYFSFILFSGESIEEDKNSGYLQLGPPDDVDVSLELNDWLFALEGADMEEKWRSYNSEDSYREESCWHTTFDSLKVKANSSKKHSVNNKKIFPGALKYPVESVTVSIFFITCI